MSFSIGGTYVYVRAGSIGHPERHLMITYDEGETTVVTTDEHLADVEVLERNRDRWTLLRLDPPTPFYCVGFLAKVSALLSGAGLDILVVSTFSKDWVLVKEGEVSIAVDALRAAGF